MEELKEKLFDIGPEDWVEILEEHSGKTFFDKCMVNDSDTGMIINLSRYPKGYYKPTHTHHCSHGIYVISGKLKTDSGVYGPGTFVWHPEGMKASHGATDECDCTFLFISNKPFDITYLD